MRFTGGKYSGMAKYMHASYALTDCKDIFSSKIMRYC